MNHTTYSTRVQAPAITDPTSNHVSLETYDEMTLNSPGRVISDGGGSGSQNQLLDVRVSIERLDPKVILPPTKILKCKKPTIFSTLNVRTLSSEKQLQELITCANANKIDIISIQEHRHYHPDTALKYKTYDNYQLITASAYKNLQGSTIGGVGMLLSAKAIQNTLNVEKISPRIIVAEFDSNPITSFISCYSPTNTSSEMDTDSFLPRS